MANNEKTKELTSGELIDALKAGKTLRRDPYQKGEEQWEYLSPYEPGSTTFFVTGWGSAIGTAADRLLLVITNPEQFEIDEDGSNS